MLKDKEKEIERYKAMHAYVVELVRATVAFEHAAVKPLFILNGGALVVVFALLGAIWNDRGQFAEKRWLVAALVCWGVGVFLAAITTAFGYRSQLAFLKHRHRELDAEHARDADNQEEVCRRVSQQEAEGKRGMSLRRWAEICGLFSLLLFLAGVVLGFVALFRSV